MDISFKLTLDPWTRIDDLAAITGRSRDAIIGDILEGGLDIYEHEVTTITQRLQEVESGTATLIPHAELDQWMRRRQKGGTA